MGQYFVLINESKREFICPFCAGGTSKFFEWLAQNQSRLLVYLMRKSSQSGGGDIQPSEEEEEQQMAGRWAGDPGINLVGDYDDSELYKTAYEQYRNITSMVAKKYNLFMQFDEFSVAERYCAMCRELSQVDGKNHET